MSLLLRFKCLVLLVVVVTGVNAEEPLDPLSSWNSRHLITCLVSLREPLTLAPENPELWAKAEYAYVGLAFGGDDDITGAIGPWLGYAEEVSAIRLKLRQGKLPTTLEEALPDMWLDVVRGDTRAAMAAYARFPEATDAPAGKALRMAATRDFRPALQDPPTSAWGQYAYVSASARQHQPLATTVPIDHSRCDPLSFNVANRWGGSYKDVSPILRSGYADVGWMIASARIPKEQAVSYLTDYLAALTMDAPLAKPVAPEKEALALAVDQAAMAFSCQRAEPLAVAYRICRELRSGEKGIFDAQGKPRLISYADVAQGMQDRVYLMAGQQNNFNAFQGNEAVPYARQGGELLEKAFPHSLIAARTAYRERSSGHEDNKRMGAAVLAELDDPLGVSPGIAMLGMERYIQTMAQDTVPTYLSVVKRIWPDAHPQRSWGLEGMCKYFPLFNCRDALTPIAWEAHRRDPYRQDVSKVGSYADPTYPMIVLDGLAAELQRIDATVDFTTPLPGTELKTGVVGHWQGWIQAPQAGPLWLAVEASKRARAFVGEEILLLGGTPGRAQRQISMPAAGLPLSLEWYQGGGGIGRVRLLYQDSSGSWQPVPAAWLSHGDAHAPGLAANYWKGVEWRRLDRPRTQDFQRITDYPWLILAQCDAAKALLESDDPEAAVALLKRAFANGITPAETHSVWRDALAFTRKAENGADLLTAYARLSCCNNNSDTALKVACTLALGHQQEAFGQRLASLRSPCCVGGWVSGQMALTRGEFAETLRFYDLLKIKPDQYLYWRVKVESAILHRVVDGTEPNWDDLRELAVEKQVTPGTRLFLSWFTGQTTWEKALAKMPDIADGEEVLWYRGLHEVTLGNYGEARALMAPMIAHHPQWLESGSAEGLSFWLAKQSAETLQDLPKAKPLPNVKSTGTEEIHF